MASNETLLYISTCCSVAALLAGCVDVDGYHLRNDLYATGGAPQYLQNTGGLSSAPTGGAAATGGSRSEGGTPSTGGSVAWVWQCAAVASNTCASASTLSACNRLPGCQYGKVPACGIQYTDHCSDMSDSMAQCASLPGCTFSTTNGSCTFNDSTACINLASDACGEALDCLQWQSATTCEPPSTCHRNAYYDSCTGTPTPCSSFRTSSTCASSHNCAWSTTDACVGTPTDCTSFTTEATCRASDNCRWKGLPADTGGTASTSAAELAGTTSSGGL